VAGPVGVDGFSVAVGEALGIVVELATVVAELVEDGDGCQSTVEVGQEPISPVAVGVAASAVVLGVVVETAVSVGLGPGVAVRMSQFNQTLFGWPVLAANRSRSASASRSAIANAAVSERPSSCPLSEK
jgi:hypothetical protein